MKASDCHPLVAITRGEIVESILYGAFIVVDSQGKVLAQVGNAALCTYPRSSMKPFQALPFIEHGGAEMFGFTSQEIAILCASHTGTDLHYRVLERMHQKVGICEDDLGCGVHLPFDSATRMAMQKAGEEPTPFRHNCSGKHTGMLAYASLRGDKKEDYLDPEHPVQVSIRQTLAEMVGMAPDEMPLGIDGCSAPVYAIPLRNMAQGIAALADPVGLDPRRAAACRRISEAMMAHPDMVAGPGKFDTDLMLVAEGKVFSKTGAEGYQVCGVMPSVAAVGSPGLGIAIKISDGDATGRARSSVCLTLLAALGVLSPEEIERLEPHGNVKVKNWREREVGAVKPAFSLAEILR